MVSEVKGVNRDNSRIALCLKAIKVFLRPTHHFEIPNWHPQKSSHRQIPSGQYVDKIDCTLRVGNGNEGERTGKPF